MPLPVVKFDCKKDGPMLVTVPGNPVIAHCRCGQSKKKPFCDGSHLGKFEAEEVVLTYPIRTANES